MINSPRMNRIRAQEAAATRRQSNKDIIIAVALLPWGYLALVTIMVGAGL